MLLSLLPALQSSGRDVELACLGPRDSPAAAVGEAVRARGVRVSYLGFRGKMSFTGLARLARLIDDRRPSLLHLHGYKAAIFGGLAARYKRTPAIVTCHAEALRTTGFETHVRIETQCIRRLARAVAVSQPIADELRTRRVPADRIRVIANGIDDPGAGKASGARAGNRLVLVGRLVDGKNIGMLIDVVAQIRADHPAVELVIAGDGPMRLDLEDRARRAGVASAVRFTGFVADISSIYGDGGVFVLPSRTEGMPISLLEAMAFGLPIVSTAVGSIPSVVRDGIEALLVEPDDVRSLREALLRVLSDTGLRHALATRARARFEQGYTARTMANAYSAVYDEVAGTAPIVARAIA
ncbi:MAG: glycosyltransferase family 4 protein [Gemmatimonadaceae bacterium]